MRRFKLLLADPRGVVYEHPTLLAAVRRAGAREVLAEAPSSAPIALPEGATLTQLPGRAPVGVSPLTGRLEVVTSFEGGGHRFTPSAVGAVLPPGYTRTELPACGPRTGPVLPQWAYTAAAWGPRGPVTWAFRTERRTHWAAARFNGPELAGLVRAHRERFPGNQVLGQLERCALAYRCFTAQNVFFVRDEGALPASTACNARCVGCISEQPDDGPPASHERQHHAPLADELVAVAVFHLENAGRRAMVSFGQGCEGEPLTRWKVLAEVIRRVRAQTPQGSININTNASLTRGLAALLDAGLDAARVSLNSADEALYAAYYQPRGYTFRDVEASIALARERGAYVALNLLVFPGVTDRSGEIAALARLVRRYRIDQVQTRPLAIDFEQYEAVARGVGAGGRPRGVAALLAALQRAWPPLRIGNFARARSERAPATSRGRPGRALPGKRRGPSSPAGPGRRS